LTIDSTPLDVLHEVRDKVAKRHRKQPSVFMLVLARLFAGHDVLVIADQVIGARQKRTVDDRVVVRICGERRNQLGRRGVPPRM
jgi:hypothetical protein